MQVTKPHIIHIADLAGVDQKTRRRLLALDYPADLDHVLPIFERAGVTRDSLFDRMGGSP